MYKINGELSSCDITYSGRVPPREDDIHNFAYSLFLNGLSKSAQTFTDGFLKLHSTNPIHIVVWGNFPFNLLDGGGGGGVDGAPSGCHVGPVNRIGHVVFFFYIKSEIQGQRTTIHFPLYFLVGISYPIWNSQEKEGLHSCTLWHVLILKVVWRLSQWQEKFKNNFVQDMWRGVQPQLVASTVSLSPSRDF